MKKVNLDLHALVVESFDAPTVPTGRRGTARGGVETGSGEAECWEFTGPGGGCALSDDGGTCFISQRSQPGCGSADPACRHAIFESIGRRDAPAG